MLSAIFVSGGLASMRNADAAAARAKPVTDRMAPYLEAVGLPTDPATLVRLNAAAHVVGGLLLATDTAARPAAAALAATMVPTTLAGHRYWQEDDPAQRANQRTHLLKNLGLMGGLLLAAVDTQGRPGLAWRAGHLADHAQETVRRAQGSVRRAAHTTAREARLATRAARLGRRLPS
jgi:putative oxidoreductase